MSFTVLSSLLRLCLVLAGLVASAPALTAEVRFGGVLPGGALVTKDVVSLGERRWVHMVRQKTDYSCGAASLATILRYAYGLEMDEPQVLAGLLKVADPKVVKQRGFSLLNIKDYVATLGLRGRGYRVDQQRLRQLRIPAIVMMDFQGWKHFVVLKRVIGDDVFIADPALGNKVMPMQEFLEQWVGQTLFVVVGNGFDRNSVLLNPKKPPTARQWLAVNGPVTNMELLDFGFTHADLF